MSGDDGDYDDDAILRYVDYPQKPICVNDLSDSTLPPHTCGVPTMDASVAVEFVEWDLQLDKLRMWRLRTDADPDCNFNIRHNSFIIRSLYRVK